MPLPPGQHGRVVDRRDFATVIQAVCAFRSTARRVDVRSTRRIRGRRRGPRFSIGRFYPFLFRRQTFPSPAAIRLGLIEGDMHRRFIIMRLPSVRRAPGPPRFLFPTCVIDEASAISLRLGHRIGLRSKLGKGSDCDLGCVNRESTDRAHVVGWFRHQVERNDDE